METVAFYSYKGGVGRTLLVANTAQFLAMAGRRVVALDLDLEAPGLHHKLSIHDVSSRPKRGRAMGAVDWLLELIEKEPRRPSLRKTAIEVTLPTGSSGSLSLIPAGAAPSQAYWAALERLNQIVGTSPRRGGLLEAVLELQARIAEELAPEFLLVDSRTGITELGGLATSVLADRVICLTTTAPEAVEGTLVVAEALRTAPRLSSQQPLQVEFVITRVPSESRGSPAVTRLAKSLGESTVVLPHDSTIAGEERLLSGNGLGRALRASVDGDAGNVLFSATLDWIARSFPSHQKAAEKAKRRMEAVHAAWRQLTATSERVRGGGTRSRKAWPVEQLRERVRFEGPRSSRQADIVVYGRPPGNPTDKPLMILEYVDSEDRDAVAQWWHQNADARVVVALSGTGDRRLYGRTVAWDSHARHAERWDLPLPHDFEALADPTDISVDTLLDAVRRGHPEYLQRIVTEWVRCSASTLHGGAPWHPDVARSIVDGLAGVDDVELARRVLWETAPSPFREMWMGDHDDFVEEQVFSELFVPVLWRLPPEASIGLLKESSRRGMSHHRPSGQLAVGLLARDMLGLRYDPDATFRLEAQRLLDRSPRQSRGGKDRDIYGLAPIFLNTEISFELSSDPPPLEQSTSGEEKRDASPKSIASLVSELIAARSLVTSGLLGDYRPEHGRVILYERAIAHCAEQLSLRARHVGSVVLLHETLHALMHLARDLDGRAWPEFALPAANSPLFEPSWFHEALTQYFTYQQIVRLRDPAIKQAFEALSDKQAPPYRAWQRLRQLPIEDARSWFMSVRRGVGAASPVARMLFDAARDEG